MLEELLQHLNGMLNNYQGDRPLVDRRQLQRRILIIGSSQGVGLTFHFTRLAIMLKKIGNEVVVLSDGNAQYPGLWRELEANGISSYTSRFVNSLADTLPLGSSIGNVLSKEKDVDLIQAGGVKQGLKVAIASRCSKYRPKAVATVGYLPHSRLGLQASRLAYGFLYDRNVALCNYTKEVLILNGVPQSRISVVPLFSPDIEWFDEQKGKKPSLETYNLQAVDEPVIFYAGGHYHHKGFECYLRAASRILRRFDATFVVGGQGPLTPHLKQLAQNLGISKRTVFTGWISNYDMPFILSQIASICISTSLIEQLPSYVLECMAAGKPVISSSVGGVSEVISEGINGYLFNPGDDGILVQRTCELISEPEKAREMGLLGRRRIMQQYNMRSAVAVLVRVYDSLLDTQQA